jgi:hypothetical protein
MRRTLVISGKLAAVPLCGEVHLYSPESPRAPGQSSRLTRVRRG